MNYVRAAKISAVTSGVSAYGHELLSAWMHVNDMTRYSEWAHSVAVGSAVVFGGALFLTVLSIAIKEGA